MHTNLSGLWKKLHGIYIANLEYPSFLFLKLVRKCRHVPQHQYETYPMGPKPYPNLIRLGLPIPLHPFTLSEYPQISHRVGGFNHLEKYESQWEGVSHILNGK